PEPSELIECHALLESRQGRGIDRREDAALETQLIPRDRRPRQAQRHDAHKDEQPPRRRQPSRHPRRGPRRRQRQLVPARFHSLRRSAHCTSSYSMLKRPQSREGAKQSQRRPKNEPALRPLRGFAPSRSLADYFF